MTSEATRDRKHKGEKKRQPGRARQLDKHMTERERRKETHTQKKTER